MANVKALRSVLRFITANPGMWDQDTWWKDNKCGTSGCVAGWAVKHSPDWSFHPKYGETRTNSVVISNHLDDSPDYSVRAVRVDVAASEVLDLDSLESKVLFFGGNNLAALWATAEAFTDGLVSAPANIKDSAVYGYFGGEFDAGMSYDGYVRAAKAGIIRIRESLRNG